MRPSIFDTMRPIMQQWAGGVDLQVGARAFGTSGFAAVAERDAFRELLHPYHALYLDAANDPPQCSPKQRLCMLCSLQPTAIYGVRVYTRGCVLREHVDVAETHHISAIINIDQVIHILHDHCLMLPCG